MKKFATLLIIAFLSVMHVNAECSYTDKADANTKAANVKVDYEIVEDKQEYEEGTAIDEYFKITILNITEELYVVVKNDVTNEEFRYNYEDTKDGEVTFNWTNTESVTNFTFTIYASSQTVCKDEQLKIINKQTPRYNDFYNRAICENMKDFYLCQKYTNIAEIDESMFIDKVEGFMDGKIDEKGETTENKKEENSFLKFLKENKWYIIGGLVVVAAGATGAIIIGNKKRGEKVK